ncbi:von Willebrand factor type A domain protein, partial [Ancylostoma caninum]
QSIIPYHRIKCYNSRTLANVLSHYGNIASPNSEMFVFTAAGASDVQTRPQLSQLLGELQTHFTYFYATDNCGSTPNDGSLTQTARLAYTSSGNVLFANSTNLLTVFSNYMPTLYGSYVLTNPTGHQQFQCPNGKDWFVEVDFATTSVYVTTTAAYGSLGVVNPMNANITPTVITTAGRTTLYKIDVDRLPGIYTLTLTSPGDCYVHVYAIGGAKVYYDFASPTPTDTTASHQDGYYGYPELGVASVVTLHADAQFGTVLKQIELFDPDTQQILMRSALYPRGDCNYEYYSDVFVCNSEAVAMFVYGEDNQAQQFRRQEITYCVDPNNRVTTTKSPGTAAQTTTKAQPVTQPAASTTVKNGQTTKGVVTPARTTVQPVTTAPPPPPISFDGVVLIDISQSAENTYDDMSLFVLTVMQNFTVSQAYARVAVVPVFGDASLGPLVIANLDAISSQSMLSDYLRQTKEGYNDFDDQGQALAQALNAAINPTFKSAGYRTNISNHLILYITATSGFSNQAPTTAQQVLQSGGYGIVTVGYGPGVTDMKSMQAVAGGNACSFYGADKQALLNQAPAVQALITAAGTNGGKYCGN